MIRVEIREAREADLPAVLGLYGQPSLDDGEVLPLEAAQRQFAVFGQYPDYKMYVATAVDEVVGTFTLLIMDNLLHMAAASAVTEAVAVREDMQGKGVGRQMMAFAIERCREKGCYKLALSSSLKREEAHRFYDRLGFERHGISFKIDTD